RRHRHRGAADDLHLRGRRQRHFQCDRCARADRTFHPRQSSGRPRQERSGRMKNFTYYRPQTAEEAVGLLDDKWGTSELLAGGTDLLDLQKEYIAQPDKVISLAGIDGLSGIEVKDDG